jgi:hypothetical protein
MARRGLATLSIDAALHVPTWALLRTAASP